MNQLSSDFIEQIGNEIKEVEKANNVYICMCYTHVVVFKYTNMNQNI